MTPALGRRRHPGERGRPGLHSETLSPTLPPHLPLSGVSFSETAAADAALGYIIAFLVLLSTVKLWHLLRLNPKMNTITSALRRAWGDISGFLIVILIMLLAYSITVGGPCGNPGAALHGSPRCLVVWSGQSGLWRLRELRGKGLF